MTVFKDAATRYATRRYVANRREPHEARPVDPVDAATGLRWWKGWSDDPALGAIFGAPALAALGTILGDPPPEGGRQAREVRVVAADGAGRVLVQVAYVPSPDEQAASRACRGAIFAQDREDGRVAGMSAEDRAWEDASLRTNRDTTERGAMGVAEHPSRSRSGRR